MAIKYAAFFFCFSQVEECEDMEKVKNEKTTGWTFEHQALGDDAGQRK